MSLSRAKASATPEERRITGRVIVGLAGAGPGEMRIADMDARGRPTVWTASTEEEYFRRVRDRAAAMALEIVEAARAEAETMRAAARVEGLAQGREAGDREAEQFLSAQAATLAQVLDSLRAGCASLWNQHRQEIVTLVRLTVEKLLNIELAQRRSEVLEALLAQAVEAIDSTRGLTVTVSPQDKELMDELVARAKAQNPRLAQFAVRPDPGVTPGGLVLESEQGMVDNSLEGRWKAIEPILDQLAIAEGET